MGSLSQLSSLVTNNMQLLSMILSSLLVLAGGRSLYYQQYPVQWYPGYPLVLPLQTVAQLRDCGLFGCIDDTATSVSGSIISGINGTFVGLGEGIKGIANGTSAIGSGIIQGTGSIIGGLASQGGNAIGGTAAAVGQAIGGAPARRLCFNGIYYLPC